MVLVACGGKRLNKRVSLWKNDKIPYGTFFAYESIPYLFSSVDIYAIRESPTAHLEYGYDYTDTTYVEDSSVIYTDSVIDRGNSELAEEDADTDTDSGSDVSAYLIISSSVLPSEDELYALLEFARQGNQVFISSANFSSAFLDTVHLTAGMNEPRYAFGDSLVVNIRDHSSDKIFTYSYPGYAMDNYVEDFDTSITTVLGTDVDDRPNFVKFTYTGGGSLYLHFAPLAFSNFFLLHKDNYRYIQQVMGHLPKNISTIYWDDYFRNKRNAGGTSTFSKLSVFLKDEILRWPLYLAAILFGIIYLFESKRKQRVIPGIAPLRNSSLDFVKTIGRLYLSRKDNSDLYSKMVAHFLGDIRTRYKINTALLDEGFAEKLAFKSGYEIESIKKLLIQIQELQQSTRIEDDELLALHHSMEDFYKKT